MDTLESFFLKQDISTDILKIILSLSKGCSDIDRKLSSYEFTGSKGQISINPTGDVQKTIDLECDKILERHLISSGSVSTIISEEKEDILENPSYQGPGYTVAYDPLDGSDNIESNGGTGTIFGIYGGDVREKRIICSGYCIYSSSSVFVLTFGEDIWQFKLNRQTKFFRKMNENLSIPSAPKKIISCNPGNAFKWNKKDKDFYDWVVSSKEKYSLRYSGCMVFDVHRVLCQGGVFFYPNPKLRALYECIPLSFVVEAAGGISIDGTKRILDMDLMSIHQKTPIIIGCKRDVLIYKNFYSINGRRSTFVIESFDSSGEEEISIKEGDEINRYNILNDKNWTRIYVKNGNSGIVPTKCLYFSDN